MNKRRIKKAVQKASVTGWGIALTPKECKVLDSKVGRDFITQSLHKYFILNLKRPRKNLKRSLRLYRKHNIEYRLIGNRVYFTELSVRAQFLGSLDPSKTEYSEMVKKIIKKIEDNVRGEGFKPKPRRKTLLEKLKNLSVSFKLKRIWRQWAKREPEPVARLMLKVIRKRLGHR